MGSQDSDLVGIRCLVVEDVRIMAETERRLLSRLGAHVVVAESVSEAHRILATDTFDVAIVDVGLPDGDGAEVVRTALGAAAPLAVLVVSGTQDRAKSLELQAMGAVVMDKHALAEHLADGVRAARRRQLAWPMRSPALCPPAASVHASTPPSPDAAQGVAPSFADVAVGRYGAHHRLSGREQEILALSLQGLADKAIGRMLDISHATVRAHWRGIVTKTGCGGQRDVIRQFARYLTGALQVAETSPHAPDNEDRVAQ